MLTFSRGEQKEKESASSCNSRKAMWLGSKPEGAIAAGCLS